MLTKDLIHIYMSCMHAATFSRTNVCTVEALQMNATLGDMYQAIRIAYIHTIRQHNVRLSTHLSHAHNTQIRCFLSHLIII